MMEKKLKPSAEDVLTYLKDFGSITCREAIEYLGTTELRSRISELRSVGVPITFKWESGKNSYGKAVKYKRYRLEDRT